MNRGANDNTPPHVQRDVQRDAPSQANGDAGVRRPDGRFGLRNQAARQHGAFARQHPAELVDAVDMFASGVVNDLGGETELTTLERAYVERLRRQELMLRCLEADIEDHGLLTPAGNVRRVFDKHQSGTATWDKLAQRLGLSRRSKAVAASPADWVVQQESQP